MSFKHMTPERRREVASMGGSAVPREKRGFFVNRTLAASAAKRSAAMQHKKREERKIQESNEKFLRSK